MAIRNMTMLVGLFFVAVGSVYSGSALGAESAAQEEGANGTSAVVAPQDEADDRGGSGSAADSGAAISPDASEDADLPEGQAVEVGSFGQIDLHVKDLELARVLQLLSVQSRRNIVASRQVSGTISADLYDVGFYEALDAILHTNGFGYREKGNFIYVYTQQEIEEMEQAQREMVSRVMRLNYITAGDASAFVQPMLSSGGSISVSGEAERGMQPSMNDAGANTWAHSEMMVIRDYPENIEQIEEVVKQLDERPKQVQIEATILEARLTDANAFGVDFAIFGRIPGTDFTSPLGAFDDLVSGTVSQEGTAGVSSPADGRIQDPTMKIGVMNNDAAVFIQALDEVTDTTMLARPQMLVLNRQRADLLVGERLGYLSSTATDTSTTQTVEFLDVGTQLTVRPFVSDDGFVRLELKPQVSDGRTDRVENGFVIPDQTTQELTTNVIVQSGQTIVLGGLFKEDTGIRRRQVPILGDLPVLGNAFRSHSDNVGRSEVIFLIKPTVIKDESLIAAAEKAEQSIEWRQVGMREGLLPWSRTKLTGSHLRRAYQYKRAGDEEKALWHTDMVLQIHPTNIEGLRLKEELTGQKMLIQDHSVLQEAVDAMVDEQVSEDDQGEAEDQPRDDEAREDDGSESGHDGEADVDTAPSGLIEDGSQRDTSDQQPSSNGVDRDRRSLDSDQADGERGYDDDDLDAAMKAAMEEMVQQQTSR